VISTRETLAWLAAFVLASALLVHLRFESDDPDSALYAAIAERLAELPPAEWIVPSWWGLWDGAGLFREHPAGVLVPPAALGALGVPARQAAYVMGLAYGLGCLLLLAWIARPFTSTREARWSLVLLQLMPVAFVFRIRANHEYPMLLCLLVAILGVDGARRSWRWLPVLPLALTAALLIKGVFVVLVALAAILWAALDPRGLGGSRPRLVAAGLLSGGVMALSVLAYDAAYARVAGVTFWAAYWERQLAPLEIATPFEGGGALARHLVFYLSLIAWHPAPWSLGLLAAAWRLRRSWLARWRALDQPVRRSLTFALGYAGAAVLLLSPSSRFAERYAFSATYVIATAGVFVTLRQWPLLARWLERLDTAIPGLPVVLWTTLVLLRLVVGDMLPRV
jgi:4-amino-4-deoxy-L-arabinose transferase-like glycosyltransferase